MRTITVDERRERLGVRHSWSQRSGGEVVYRLLEDVGSDATAAVGRQAEALAKWLGGTTVTARFRASLDKGLAG
jgi:hypothetical protein